MAVTPRVVYAARDTADPVPVHVRPKFLPIVVIPGIMGSRLTDPRTGELAWNPMGEPLGDGPGAFTADFERIQQVAAPLVPDETHRYERASQHREVQHIKHWYNLIPEFYGDLAKHLAALQIEALEARHLTPRVYCCGYDWRQDNARSASRLAGIVDEALRETGARKVILVAHSMGGLVARYFCRVLGGESKVHQLILLASPTLGSPAAYAQLRKGLYGVYVKDISTAAQTGDDEVLADELVDAGMQVFGGVASIASQGASAIAPVFGDLLIAFSLGAGRFLTRDESRYFARQIPALYQLLPNAAFCNRFRDWVIFDPMATGHRPTGFMLQLPTALDLLGALGGASVTDALLSGSERVAAQLRDGLEAAAAGGESAEVSGRALRSSMTLGEWGEAIATLMAEGETGEAIALMLELVEHAGRAFVDARSSRALYGDIYTGLLDIVSLRALSATNLALALAFDEALTVDDRPRDPLTLLTPVKEVFGTLGRLIGDAASGPKKALDKQEMRNLIQAELDAHPPRVYMHPRTFNVYGRGVPGDGGAIVVPRALVSRDDSNLVKVTVLSRPVPIGLPHALGDGTVPEASANPPPELLSNPFVGEPVGLADKSHNVVPAHRDAFAAIDRAIGEQIAHYPLD
ncbi:MAG: hypothetical protein R3A48_01065 [Polyangiales bacterium]